MKSRQHRLHLILLVLGILFSAGYLALAQDVRESPLQVGDAQTNASITGQVKGTPAVATKSATVNVRELAAQQALIPEPYREPVAISEPGAGPQNLPVPSNVLIQQEPQAPDSFNESNAPLIASPAPTSTFKALEDNGTSIPPDTNGSVGLNHLMVATNTQIRLQSKTGANLVTTVSLSSFWAPLGNPNVFDPKVLYDRFNNRWIFVCTADASAAASSILIGISNNSDPTGNWKIWKVDADAANTKWADYPSVGFNKNWIAISVNMFQIGGGFVRSDLIAFNKSTLYAGNIARYVRFQDTSGGFTEAPAVTYDNTLNTLYLVDNWNGNSGGHGFLRISTLTGTAAAPVLTKGTSFPSTTSLWNGGPPGGFDFAPQLGSTRKIQNGDNRMLKVIYRNGFLWCVHTVFLPAGAAATRSAVQWWQLSPTGTVQQRGRVDDPTGHKFFAYPSIAVNKNNDVLIGYSRFSSQQYASANYSFRAGTDPINTLRSDAVLKAGSAPYYKIFSGTANRWGDYSNTEVDPANDLDLWTIQEHAAPVSGGSSRWGTWWGRIKR